MGPVGAPVSGREHVVHKAKIVKRKIEMPDFIIRDRLGFLLIDFLLSPRSVLAVSFLLILCVPWFGETHLTTEQEEYTEQK
jgi:hypothetical protein